MTVQPIDLPAILGIVVGGLFVLIPVTGLTVRFALKPLLQVIAALREANGERSQIEQLSRRVAALERQLEAPRAVEQISPGLSPLAELPANSGP